MLNFDLSAVKHGTQNIKNDCHQWLSDRFRVHRIRFRPRLRLGPHWGSFQSSPDPLAGLRDLLLFRGRGKEEGKGRGRAETPLSQIPGSAPAISSLFALPIPNVIVVLSLFRSCVRSKHAFKGF